MPTDEAGANGLRAPSPPAADPVPAAEGSPDEPADVWRVATRDSALPVPYRPAPLVPQGRVAAPASSPVRLLLAGADVALDAVRAALGSTDPRVRWTGDAVLGAAWTGYRVTGRVAGLLARPALPVARTVVDPPFIPRGWRPATLADRAAVAWRQQRGSGRAELARAVDVTVPRVVGVAVEPLDLTRLVLDDVQLDVVATAVVRQLDLTDIVLTQVDLQRVAQAVLDQLDLTSVARERIDLAELAEEVIDAVDLPEIIRESTGSVASESVRSVRMQSIHADDRVQELVDRVLRWRKQRNTEAPAGSAESDDDPATR